MEEEGKESAFTFDVDSQTRTVIGGKGTYYRINETYYTESAFTFDVDSQTLESILKSTYRVSFV